ncbi:MAG: 50S ribosomal protein L4 [Candidatus Moranbacteria bacterium RIFCSPHIGHO2_01_FULL_55_24]|nr:MAG: 50S ribosomal protein L4 [Candidatus Moranbacteria bacterium RIFCSPHIGHO2_01_FULL_55_24]
MIKVSVKNLKGAEVKELTLKESLFGLPSNDALLHQVYVALQANLRQPIAHTKDRSERRGSGRKPWRQKGTGRARVGEVRSPIWRKGGVVFGPTSERNYSKDANRKMRQKAVMIALADKIREGKCVVVDALAFSEMKTKHFAEAKQTLGMGEKSLVAGLTKEELPVARVIRNIPKADSTLAENLNVLELLNHEFVLLSEASLARLEERFAKWEK